MPRFPLSPYQLPRCQSFPKERGGKAPPRQPSGQLRSELAMGLLLLIKVLFLFLPVPPLLAKVCRLDVCSMP